MSTTTRIQHTEFATVWNDIEEVSITFLAYYLVYP
jgi:hypothetical protein